MSLRSLFRIKPNGELADRLRAIGLGRIVDSERVRRALGIPIRTGKAQAPAQQSAPAKPAPAPVSEAKHRYQSVAKSGLLWQRLQLLQEGAEAHSKELGWQRDLAKAENDMGNYLRAAEVGQHIERLKGHHFDDCFAQAHAWAMAGFSEKAEAAIARGVAIAEKSGNAEAAKLGLGGYYQRKGDWDYAAEAYANSFNAAKRRLRVDQELLGELAFRAGLASDRCFRWDEAEDYYRFALSVKPNDHYWAYKLGLALDRQEQWDEAAEMYLYSVSISPQSQQKYRRYRALYSLHMAGRFRDACLAFLGDEYFLQGQEPEQGELEPIDEAPVLPLRVLRASTLEDDMRCFANYWIKLADLKQAEGDAGAEALALRAAIDRTYAHSPHLFERLGVVEFRRGEFEAASLAFVNSRLFRTPDGIDLKPYEQKNQVAFAARYTEYRLNWPVDMNVVLFESYHGAQISCHPLALFEQMLDDPRFDGFTLVWVLKAGSEVPDSLRKRDSVVVVERDSDLFHRYLATAGWLVSNVSFPPYFVRRDEQKYLNTWHGTPIKTLGRDIKPGYLQHANVARNFLHATHLISPCAWTTEVLLDKYDVRGLFTGKVAEVGSPRADHGLRMTDTERSQLRTRLGAQEGVPLVLYAPTWRGVQGKPSAEVGLTQQALAELDTLTEASVLFRGHHYAEQAIRKAGLASRLVPSDISTNDLLAIVDILITDYSSIFFDYLPFDKPMVFFVPDEEEYQAERGLYFDVAELPGVISREVESLSSDVEEALEALASPEKDPHRQVRSRWAADYASKEDGHATSRTIEFFFFGDSSHEVQVATDKPRILMHAGLLPNGITTSVQNLAASIEKDSVVLANIVAPESLLNSPERKEQFDLLSENVIQIGRVGAPAYAVEERWVVLSFNRTHRFFSEAHREVALKTYAREFKRIFGPVEFDVGIEFDGYAPFWAVLLAASDQLKKKVIYQHNDLYAEWTKKYPELAVVFSLYERFDRIVAVSPSIRDLNSSTLGERFGVADEKFVVAHNQINPASVALRAAEEVDPDVEAWLNETEGHTFTTIGRLSVEKSHDLLIESFAEVCRTVPARLVIIGSGFLQPDLEELAARLGVRDRVLFTGQRSNPMSILRYADTFVLTSKHEGQPMVLGEAMMLQKPILSTDLPGTRDMLEDGYGTLLAHDKEEFVRHMISAAVDGIAGKEFDAEGYMRRALTEFADIVGLPLSLDTAKNASALV